MSVIASIRESALVQPLDSVLLQRKTAAIEVHGEIGKALRLGLCLHLEPGSLVNVLGQGISRHTVRVGSGSRQFIILKKSLPLVIRIPV